MKQTPSYPPPPPGPGPLLRAVGVLLKGPLGVVLALVVGVGALALVDGIRPDPDADVAVPEPSRAPPPVRGEPRSPQANLWVDSDVVGALVVVGGDTTGVTPVWVRGLAPGLVRVAVSSRGVRRDTTVYVADGDDLDLSLRLGPAAQPPRARAPSSPDPPPDGGAPDPPADAQDAVPPPARAPEPLPRSAPEAQPSPRRSRGELRVTAPPGTALYVDGRFEARVGRGPATVSLAPGDHRVRVIYPSLALEETTVYVGRTIVVSLSFGPDPGRE